MVDRKKLRGETIMDRVSEVSLSLDENITAYLIGGLGMYHHGLKAVTKDIDIVFLSGKELSDLIKILKKLGYRRPEHLPDVYLQMGTQAMLEGSDGFLFDMFLKRVCGCLELSDGMVSRSEIIELAGNLTLKVVSPEDIFLFKSITSRPDDLEDMANIAAGGLDWEIIEQELRGQPDYWKWLMMYFIRLEELEEEYAVVPPNMPEIMKEAEIAAGIGLILTRLEGNPISETDALDMLDRKDKDFSMKAIEKMKELELISIRDGMIHPRKNDNQRA